MAKQTYDATKLQLIEGLDHVRARPGMYIGSRGVKGLHHLIEEIVANSVDEAMAGYCDEIIVEVKADGWVSVQDNARGIPVDIHPETGLSGLELVLTRLGGGGKWGEEDGGYKVSGGLHGVGSSVVNALSSEMKAIVSRDDYEWNQNYKQGVPQSAVTKGKKTKATGTYIAWKYDPTIFDKGVKYDRSTIELRLRELSYLNPGLAFVLRFHGHKEETFLSKSGLADYMKYLVAGRDTVDAVHNQPIQLQGEMTDEDGGKDVTYIDIALLWTTSQNELPHMFVNSINTFEGGTHYDGFRSGLRKALNEAAEELGKFRAKDTKFEQVDTREGLFSAISVRVSNPQFESQTKIKLGNVEVEKRVNAFVAKELRNFLLEKKNKAIADQIIQRVIEARDGRLAAGKARNAVQQRKGLLGSSGLPGKLADCSSKNREETELFIVEGDSAGGGMKQKRDRNTQAVLPLRGKIQNAEKSGEGTLNSEAIKDILSALGGVVTPVQVQVKKGGKMVNRTKLIVDLKEPRYGSIYMCSVDYEENTIIKDIEGKMRWVQIGGFIDDLITNDGDPSDYEVLCFGLEDQQTKFKPLKSVIRHGIDEPLHKIRTQYGREIRVTSSHSVFIWENNQIQLKAGSDIKEGDLLVAPQRIPSVSETEETVIDLITELHQYPSAESVWLRGKSIAQIREQRLLNQTDPGVPHLQERFELGKEHRNILRTARIEAGYNLAQIAPLVGAKQAASVSEWETGRGRPSVRSIEQYCEAVGLDIQVFADAEIVSSSFVALRQGQETSERYRLQRSIMRLSELTKEEIEILDDDVVLTSQAHADVAIPRYLPLGKDLFFLIGAYAAEGSTSERAGVRFSLGPGPADTVLERDIEQASINLFGIMPQRYNTPGSQGFERRISSHVVATIFRDILGFGKQVSYTKHLPDLVFNASIEDQIECLRGMFLGDGSYRKSGGVTFNTTSKIMADQTSYLLGCQGIVPSSSSCAQNNGRHNVHTVSVNNREELLSIRLIWQDRLDAIELEERNYQQLTITSDSPEYVTVGEAAALTQYDQRTIRSALMSGEIDCILPEGNKRRDRKINYEQLVTWSNNRVHRQKNYTRISDNLIGLRVLSTEEVEATNGQVYDFSVEGDENFICGSNGGICCHNTDADVDGGHIATLLMTFFFRFAPDIIRDGRLYIAELPLYRVEHKKKGRLYLFTDADLQKHISADDIKKRPDGTYDIGRFKGLGEMQPEQLQELALDPATRRTRRVVIDDLAEAEDMTVLLMGSRVDRRREYIEEHALDVEADI